MKLSKDFTVRWHETNANREMTPSAILVLMQEMANLHMKEMYPCLEDFRDVERKAFILSKIYIRFKEPIYAYDKITVSTWTGKETKGFSFYRSFSVERSGETVADALSVWALTDIDKKTIVPISEFKNNFENEESVEIDMPRRIKFPVGKEFELAGKKKITYSDIDYNCHMNNTRYPNMLIDSLPSPENYRIKGMSLSFLSGSVYNDEISIYRVSENGSFYFKTLNSDGKVCLEAVVTTEKREGSIR